MILSVSIPLKSYLKKYIHVSFGDSIKLTERTAIGIIILNILKRKTYKNPNYDFKKNMDNLDASIDVEVSLDKMYRYGVVLLKPQIYYINRSLDDLFKTEIIKQALINQSCYSVDFKTSINNILDAYDITEEELNYQSIRKYYNRNYKSFQKRMIL